MAKEAFEAPKNLGAAEIPKNMGTVTKKTYGPKTDKKSARTIHVVVTANMFFDGRRVPVGAKLTVSEQEFSESCMEKI